MISPSAMHTTTSDTTETTSMSCSTNSTVMPSPGSSLIFSSRASRKRRVHARHRLVQHEQPGRRHDGPGQLEQLALAARERAGVVGRLLAQPDPARPARRHAPRARPPAPSIATASAPRRTARPVAPCAPRRTLSSTDSRGNTLADWKVRTMPAWAIAYAGLPARSWPSNLQLPPSARSKPVSRLKNVVLPAPFGPIRATMRPASIEKSSTDTARTPPKERCTSFATRIGPVPGREVSGHRSTPPPCSPGCPEVGRRAAARSPGRRARSARHRCRSGR